MVEWEDFASPEVAIASGVTATLLHPLVRRWMRRGVVLGLAGVLGVVDATKAGVSMVQKRPALGADLMDEERTAAAPAAKTQRGRSQRGHDTGED